MQSIEDIIKRRFMFLYKLYEVTEGDETAFAYWKKIGKFLRFGSMELHRIVTYLQSEGLVKFAGFQEMMITHIGIKEIEEALKKPDKPTDHFPANIIIVGKIINSTLQQGSSGTTQVINIGDNKSDQIREIVKQLRDSIDKLGLKSQELHDVKADIETIEAQLNSSKPKSSVILECFGTIKNIFETIVLTGTATPIVADLIDKIKELI